MLPKLSSILLLCVCRETTKASMALWSSMVLIPWPTQPRPCPSCAKTWANPSFWLVHRWKQQTQNRHLHLSFSMCPYKKPDVFRCPSTRRGMTAETTCWGLCSSRASFAFLRWGDRRHENCRRALGGAPRIYILQSITCWASQEFMLACSQRAFDSSLFTDELYRQKKQKHVEHVSCFCPF